MKFTRLAGIVALASSSIFETTVPEAPSTVAPRSTTLKRLVTPLLYSSVQVSSSTVVHVRLPGDG